MIGQVLAGFKQMGQYVNPTTLKRLREAGATDPRGILAIPRALPWLLGRGPSLGIISRINALVLGDKPAIHDRNGTTSFKELEQRANRAAHLLEELGVRPSESIGLLLRNGREGVEISLGAQKVGIVACPYNTWAKPKELQSMIDGSRPRVIFYDTKHSEQITKIDAQGAALLFVGDGAGAVEGSSSYEEALARQAPTPPFPFTKDAGTPRVVIHTSGTTGAPKGAKRNAAAHGIGALADILAIVPYKRDDVVLVPAPLFHSFGLATFTFATALGATMILPEKFDPEGSLRAIEEHRATAASFVPVMIRRMVSLDADVRQRYDLSSLRIVLASGSAMSEDLRRAAMDLFGDVLYDLYGSTEVGWVTIASPEDIRKHPRTVGKPVPGIDIAIFSEDGRKLAPGEVGEIFVKSEVLFEGYTSGDEKTVRDGYMTIGDVGRLDEDGYLFIEGRADDMVVVGGENIYPVEIEGVIEDVGGVEEAAVIGVPDEEYGEVLGAFVVGRADVDEIRKACESELASYKVPRRIEIVDELPRTSTGKVVKRELLEKAAKTSG